MAVFSSGSTSAFGAGATLPNSSIQSTISGPPNIVVQSATIALAPQCQPGKTVLTVTATYTNTGGSLASNALGLVAADVTNPNFGRMDFIPALGAGQTGTMTLSVAYLQPNPEKMVGQRTFGVGLYNKPPMVNVKVAVPAAFCGFNPSSLGAQPRDEPRDQRNRDRQHGLESAELADTGQLEVRDGLQHVFATPRPGHVRVRHRRQGRVPLVGSGAVHRFELREQRQRLQHLRSAARLAARRGLSALRMPPPSIPDSPPPSR